MEIIARVWNIIYWNRDICIILGHFRIFIFQEKGKIIVGRTTKANRKTNLLRKNLEQTTDKEKEVNLNSPRFKMTERRKELNLPTRKELASKAGTEPIYDALRFPHIAYTLCKEYGFTQLQLAQVFDVKLGTVEQWGLRHKEFKLMMKKGRDEYDGEHVENALLKKALGYTFEEKSVKKIRLIGKVNDNVEVHVPAIETIVTTKHMSPDTKAIMFWLQNRNPKRWKNMTYVKVEEESHTSHTEIHADVTNMKSEDLRALRDIIVAQQSNAIPIECQNIPDDDLDVMLEKAKDVKLIEDAVLVNKE